jgi:hypothetical protein
MLIISSKETPFKVKSSTVSETPIGLTRTFFLDIHSANYA